jgi:hypothetical protein
MDKSTLRIVSKAGFLLVAIGFLMPFALNQNGFQVAGYLSQFIGQNAVTSALYAMFFISCGGCVLFFLLIMKKDFSIIFDWVTIVAASITLMTVLSEISKVLSSVTDFGSSFGFSGAGRRVGNALSEYIQPGAYLVIIGVIVALVAQILIFLIDIPVPAIGLPIDCPFCAKIINSAATVCQFCSKELPKANDQFIVTTATAIRSLPEDNAKIINHLKVDYKVYFQNQLKNKKENSLWFYIKTSDLGEGWCNVAHLKQC